MRLLGSVLLGGLVWYYFQAKKFTQKYRVSFFGLTVDKNTTVESGFKKIAFLLKLKLINPTDFVGKISAVYVDFFYAGSALGRVDIQKVVNVPKNSESIIEVPVSLDVLSSVNLAPKIFKELTASGLISLRAVGVVVVNAGNYRFDKSFTIKVLNGGITKT